MGSIRELIDAIRAMQTAFPRYLVSYDLHAEDPDYSGMYDLLESLGAKQFTESTYVFHSPLGIDQLLGFFRKCISGGKSFVIVRIEDIRTYNI